MKADVDNQLLVNTKKSFAKDFAKIKLVSII